MSLDPPSDTGGSEITAHVLEADDGKGTELTLELMETLSIRHECNQGLFEAYNRQMLLQSG